MSGILKTEGIVLSVIDYGDTSKIAGILTKEYGKISVIVKGAKQKASKMGKIIDPLNILNIVFYQKDNRDLQILSEADLIHYYSQLHEDYDKLKYGLASVELINTNIEADEVNIRLYSGLKRILERIALSYDPFPIISFLRFLMFFIEEMGYEINFDSCNNCHEPFNQKPMGFSSEIGFICGNCNGGTNSFTRTDTELFALFECLKSGKGLEIIQDSTIQKVFGLLFRYAQYHIPGFRSLNSLKM